MIFDTHAHYDDKAFDEDREELLTRLFAEKVGCIVNQGTNLELSKYGISLAKKYDTMYYIICTKPPAS